MIATTLDIAGLGGGTVRLGAEELGRFRARVDGDLIAPFEQGWQDAIRIWNGMAARTPALVFQPASTRDVLEAVRLAGARRLALSIKGGGHNIAGTAIADRGLMLDMARLRDVIVEPDARRVHVGAGCRLGEVDRATQDHGLATVLGFISDVGVAGLTLGGGLGYLTRRFGWTADNLEEIELVTADGDVRIASRASHPDLFWALRGGGGNFGVVTRFTFRLHEVGPIVVGGLIAWPFDRADEILQAYRAITASAPRELALWMVLLVAPPAPFVPAAWHGRRLCAMAVCYTGDRRQTGEVLAPLRALGTPVVDLLAEQLYVRVQSYLDATEPQGHHYYWKTEYVADLPAELLATIRDLFAECPIPGAQIGLLHLAGALNERDPADGAVGNRDARFALGVNGMWEPDDPRADMFARWIRSAWQRVRRFSTGGNYINFQTADEDQQRVRATYGGNFDRLVEVKKKWDPENLFRVNRNIPIAASSS